MSMLIGLVLLIFGMYALGKGRGMEKPMGLGIVGISMIFLPGGSSAIAKILSIVIPIVIAFIWACIYQQNEENGTNDRLRAAEIEQINREYDQAVASQSASEPWAIRYAIEPCPHCGHYKVRNAKWEDKQMSVAFWGIASTKIGTSFKCEHCGEMW